MQFIRVNSQDEVRAFLSANKLVALDTETTGLNPRKDKLLDVVLANRQQAIIFKPEYLHALHGTNNEFVIHNAKFDLAFLFHNGIDLRDNAWHDTTILDHLLNENAPHSLDHIVQERYHDNYKEIFWAQFASYESAPEDEKIEYACKDAIYTAKLYYDLRRDLENDGIPNSLIVHCHKLARALLDTELEGLQIDLNYLTELGGKLQTRINELQLEMRDACSAEVELVETRYWEQELLKRKTIKGRRNVPRPEFNFSSQRQLIDLLYNELRLPQQINKRTRKPTVDDAALERLERKHPVIPLIRELRGLEKVYGSYIEGTLERLEAGRIYPSFKINGTVTGRISSENPNMQQLPRDGGVRGIYVPTSGHKVITADFGMLEVVIAAHFSRDSNLLKIIREGASKHDITAEALKIPRQQAKTLNFAMQYLCSAYKVAEILGISKRDAEYVHNLYWETYAGEREVIEECKARVNRGEPIVNLFGRKRRFPSRFDNVWQREEAYRQAYNAKIQGTGADITHYAFYEVWRQMRERGLGRAWFEVHDEIVVECKDYRVLETRELLERVMTGAADVAGLSLPLTVDVSEPKPRWEK